MGRGYTKTNTTATVIDEQRERMRSKIPVGRTVLPEQTAAVVAFVAGDRAGYISGAAVPVDGRAGMGPLPTARPQVERTDWPRHQCTSPSGGARNACDESAAAAIYNFAGSCNASKSRMSEEGAEPGMDPAETQADEESEGPLTFGRSLRRARLAKLWSQLQLVHRMREVGAEHRGAATSASLLIMMSKWENDRKNPNQYNLHLLAAALEVPVESLNLPVDPDFVF